MLSALVASFAEPVGQGWDQIGQLSVALGLSTLIGLERELRQRSAGLRTHALVGVAAALIMETSKYGFTDILSSHVILDPSRMAAQVVSGIGFIGGGLIFVRRDAVRGLTTAATIWLTAAIGMAAGAGLEILATLVMAAHFLVVYGFTPVVHRLESLGRQPHTSTTLRIDYRDREGVLRKVLAICSQHGFVIDELMTEQVVENQDSLGVVSVIFRLQGPSPAANVVAELSEVPGVLSISAKEADGDE